MIGMNSMKIISRMNWLPILFMLFSPHESNESAFHHIMLLLIYPIILFMLLKCITLEHHLVINGRILFFLIWLHSVILNSILSISSKFRSSIATGNIELCVNPSSYFFNNFFLSQSLSLSLSLLFLFIYLIFLFQEPVSRPQMEVSVSTSC